MAVTGRAVSAATTLGRPRDVTCSALEQLTWSRETQRGVRNQAEKVHRGQREDEITKALMAATVRGKLGRTRTSALASGGEERQATAAAAGRWARRGASARTPAKGTGVWQPGERGIFARLSAQGAVRFALG